MGPGGSYYRAFDHFNLFLDLQHLVVVEVADECTNRDPGPRGYPDRLSLFPLGGEFITLAVVVPDVIA